MEDFGTGELERGVAVVKIDPAFAETVTADASYHVFITPNGDSEGLYVIRKTPTSFEVRESKGGTSSLSFDYRIVAKRRGYEADRLKDVTERYNEEKEAAMPARSVEDAKNANPLPPMKRGNALPPPVPAANEEGTRKNAPADPLIDPTSPHKPRAARTMRPLTGATLNPQPTQR